MKHPNPQVESLLQSYGANRKRIEQLETLQRDLIDASDGITSAIETALLAASEALSGVPDTSWNNYVELQGKVNDCLELLTKIEDARRRADPYPEHEYKRDPAKRTWISRTTGEECPGCKRNREENQGYGPDHDGSKCCRCGSLASGGTKTHCSCDACL